MVSSKKEEKCRTVDATTQTYQVDCIFTDRDVESPAQPGLQGPGQECHTNVGPGGARAKILEPPMVLLFTFLSINMIDLSLCANFFGRKVATGSGTHLAFADRIA
jgi:hypothetical protein